MGNRFSISGDASGFPFSLSHSPTLGIAITSPPIASLGLKATLLLKRKPVRLRNPYDSTLLASGAFRVGLCNAKYGPMNGWRNSSMRISSPWQLTWTTQTTLQCWLATTSVAPQSRSLPIQKGMFCDGEKVDSTNPNSSSSLGCRIHPSQRTCNPKE